ncbi:NUDIX hydrolase [Jannaschia pagri]|uniref:NUDIX hydrolase n=1 Tax=Jannaschia pagri TaxID=2829797 RepID=A0ABQ4NLC5_9RHOB|nr:MULTISPECIES: GDP-mannose pyrophosphatase [unclassified Jannaschia]GIT91070.1 NUDIX hydrolase [Jannaschia sp. AI_61]GIT94902.1 NUDIX hydrolase [Jannaschia sp. AI_62]
MSDTVRPISTDVLSEDYGILTRHRFALRRRDGTWSEQTREVYDRGNGACCLLYDPDAGTVLLTRQFRLPVHLIGADPMFIEVPAGVLDGAGATERMHAELLEETGYAAESLTHVTDLIAAPASALAYNACFTGTYRKDAPIGRGGGLEAEGEDIEVLHIPLAEALRMISDGRIRDGKTVFLIQHTALREAGLLPAD